jgi:hypothetical protein
MNSFMRCGLHCKLLTGRMRDLSSNASVPDITHGQLRHQVGAPTVSDGSPVVTTATIGSGNEIRESATQDVTLKSVVTRHETYSENTSAAFISPKHRGKLPRRIGTHLEPLRGCGHETIPTEHAPAPGRHRRVESCPGDPGAAGRTARGRDSVQTCYNGIYASQSGGLPDTTNGDTVGQGQFTGIGRPANGREGGGSLYGKRVGQDLRG